MMPIDDLMTLLMALPGRRVLIVGDLMLDEYIWGDVRRISPEAPVPVVHRRGQTYRPGGAGNVAANVAALGGVPVLVGIVGQDIMAETLRTALADVGVNGAEDLIAVADRPTTVKSRIMGHHQQMLRLDTEVTEPVSPAVAGQVLARCRHHIAEADVCLLSDYAKGLLTPALCQELIGLAQRRGIPVVVDPKGRDYRKYAGATVITPNTAEALLAAGLHLEDGFELADVVQVLRLQIGPSHLLITRGAEGMTLYPAEEADGIHIPAAARAVYDVTGAGDTVAATVALALAAGASLPAAARLAATAAGIVVGKLGTATVSWQELWEQLQ
jgi:D-beta-D-heptose 7-phosphate kinase/D-beta-D-heptose 1-phosphate adenosyltransferase